MARIRYTNPKIEQINKAIEEVREMLNEICSTADEGSSETRLAVSRYLDELIVQYLKELKSQT